MGRPIKNGLDYFPHDTDAVNDEKVEALRSIHGNDGYAFYFILLERIYRTDNAELDISEPETLQILASKLAVTPQKFAEILSTALKWGCFDKTEYDTRHVLTSNGIRRRASGILAKREKMRLHYATFSDAETEEEIITEMGSESTQAKQRKAKERKIDTTNKEQELQNYTAELRGKFTDIDFDGELEKFNLYWSEGKRRLKRPKLALLNWMNNARKYKNRGNGSGQKRDDKPQPSKEHDPYDIKPLRSGIGVENS